MGGLSKVSSSKLRELVAYQQNEMAGMVCDFSAVTGTDAVVHEKRTSKGRKKAARAVFQSDSEEEEETEEEEEETEEEEEEEESIYDRIDDDDDDDDDDEEEEEEECSDARAARDAIHAEHGKIVVWQCSESGKRLTAEGCIGLEVIMPWKVKVGYETLSRKSDEVRVQDKQEQGRLHYQLLGAF